MADGLVVGITVVDVAGVEEDVIRDNRLSIKMLAVYKIVAAII
jgi:hypothetical protein